MASRRSSASASGTSSMSDTTSDDAPQSIPQRRGGARFNRVVVEPTRGAALLAQSPVNTDVAVATAPRAMASNHQRSTPTQPVRRTLFSRLFRMKGHDEERGISVSAAASPASHQSTPTHDERPTREAPRQHMTTTTSAHELIEHHDSRLQIPGFTRVVTMPYHKTKTQKSTSPPVEVIAATPPPLSEDPEHTRVLLEGLLVKLSSHKYWHARATFFVLEEAIDTTEARSCIWLKQFRKKRVQTYTRETNDEEPPLMEIELSEHDVVVDISDRYIKHGLELFHRVPVKSIDQHDLRGHDDVVLAAAGELFSLRLSVDDAGMHRKWMRVLGSAIARLIDQSKRHYPITPADVEFARGTLKVFEPGAVTAIVGTSIPVKTSAKVQPKVDSSSSSSSEDEAEVVDENQGEILLGIGDCDRQDEMRNPEEPETHSDCDEENSQRPSHEASSEVFSDAWASPHHDNNNLDFDNNYHERSSNQLDDQTDDEHEQQGHFQRLSECYAANGSVVSAVAAPNTIQASPIGTASVASSPSPQSPRTNSSIPGDEAELNSVSTAMAATSLGDDDAVIDTPPPSPQRSSSKLYSRRHLLATHSRGSAPRPPIHSFTANGQVFTLDVRYHLVKSIGNGAYGAVIAASDSVADMSVAVKKITNIFDDLVDAKRILREVRLLRHFHHKNITQLLDLAPPMTKKTFEDMYIITELMETDLHQVIYSMQPMSDDHVKYFLYQMLCALYHIHSAGVLHRDMKPSNILLNSNCDLKVCDFGLARGGMDPNSDAKRLAQPGELTEYVVTRWYRAPEIMLNCLQYTAAIDVWAVGCIFAEMLLREPLFPGNDYMHQLKLIIKFLGTPKQEDIAFIKNVKALRFLTKLSISKPRKLREVFTGDDVNPLALDLLSQMLIFNPVKRISVEQALQHPYLATFYDPADITRSAPFSFDFDLPDDKLTKEALVDLLCEDVACFHPALMASLNPPTVPMPILPRPSMTTTTNGGNRYFGTTASAS